MSLSRRDNLIGDIIMPKHGMGSFHPFACSWCTAILHSKLSLARLWLVIVIGLRYGRVVHHLDILVSVQGSVT